MEIALKDLVFVYQMQDPEDITWHTRRHTHGPQHYELHYFIQGEGRFRVGSRLHTVRPGLMFVCPPTLPHAVETTDLENPITYYAVLFTVEDPESPLRDHLMRTAAVPTGWDIGRNHRFFFEELKDRSLSASPLRQRSAVHQLLSFLYLLGDGDLPKGEPGNVHLERALDLMQDQVFGSLKLPEVAEKLSITESYLIRLFRTKLNITPMKYYTRLKVEAAAALLADTPLAIYEIADRLQFYSEYHFSRVFKQYTGQAPSRYRKEQYRHHGKLGDLK